MNERDIAAEVAEGLKELEKIRNCQHRWEESAFGKQYWEPGTHQYTCHRCGSMQMVQIGIDQGKQT